MPVVLVHGVPDTARVWDKLRGHLARRDVVTLSLPGFGTPLPAGFEPTKEAYADWVAAEFARIGTGLDVLGHDWGCLLTLRAVMLRPDLIRSFAVGGAPLDPEYTWHATAQLWQTPGIGEQVMAMTNAQTMPPSLMAAGVPQADAEEAAKQMDDTMKRCILGLYRSAVNVGAEWGPDLAKIRAPGLVLWGERDPFAEPKYGERLAASTRAKWMPVPNCSHWYQLERPLEVARALDDFWAALP